MNERAELRREPPVKNLINIGLANINAVPLYYGLQQDPTGGTNPDRLPAAQPVRRPERVPPQHVRELPRPAGAARPSARQVQFHAAYTFSKVARRSAAVTRNGQAVGSEYIWDVRDAQLRHPGLRPDARGERIGELAAARAQGQGRVRRTRFSAAGRSPASELRQRRADLRQLRHRRNHHGRHQHRLAAHHGVEPGRPCSRSSRATRAPTSRAGTSSTPPASRRRRPATTAATSCPTSRPRPTPTSTCPSSRTSRSAARVRSCSSASAPTTRSTTRSPILTPSTNLTLHYTNGVQDNADFGKLPQDNKYGRRIVQLVLRFTF